MVVWQADAWHIVYPRNCGVRLSLPVALMKVGDRAVVVVGPSRAHGRSARMAARGGNRQDFRRRHHPPPAVPSKGVNRTIVSADAAIGSIRHQTSVTRRKNRRS